MLRAQACEFRLSALVQDGVVTIDETLFHKWIRGARLLSGCDIGEECLIAAGAVVRPGTRVPDRMLVVGVPGRIVRPVNDKELEYLRWLGRRYVELVRKYQAGEFGEPPAGD